MEKHKTIWTSEEELNLCHQIKLGQSIEKIAKLHQRTEKAIEMRLATIFKKRLEKGEKMNVLMNEFNLTEKQIRHYMKECEENKKKYETKNNSVKEENGWSEVHKKLDLLEKHLLSIEKRLDKIEKIETHIYKNLKVGK